MSDEPTPVETPVTPAPDVTTETKPADETPAAPTEENK